jgi:hypothetical protein
MATINATLPTLKDIASRMDPKGGLADIVESLARQNPLLEGMAWKEGNLPTGHLITSRTALPSGTWRRFNEGVTPQKSTTDQVTETCGMLEGLSKIDVDLAKLNGNEAAFRASEDDAFIAGLANDLETAFFYASTKTDPERIMGLSPRLDSTTGPWGGQVITSSLAASGNDQTSIWLVCWGPKTVYGIYPKGSQVGLETIDMGRQLVRDANSKEFLAYVTSFKWKVGLAVEDARFVVRLANIDTSAISTTGMQLIQDMIRMVAQVPNIDMGRPVIYANRKIATYLQLQALDATKNSTLTFDNIGGKRVTNFQGIPIQVSDAITNTEAVVS